MFINIVQFQFEKRKYLNQFSRREEEKSQGEFYTISVTRRVVMTASCYQGKLLKGELLSRRVVIKASCYKASLYKASCDKASVYKASC